MSFLQRPQPGGAGIFPPTSIGNIEHIAQAGPVARIVHQGDALGAAPDVAAHAVVPQVVLGAGGGVRALGVDHHLLMERIFVEAGGGGEKARPFLPAAGELDRHFLRHLRIHFCLGWHGCLSSLHFWIKEKAGNLEKDFLLGGAAGGGWDSVLKVRGRLVR